ncbi:MAG: hypothetical protein SFV81_05295 [Pirellulaceae bacterium]|nr:hypothetical protein [Pirellulaceae bacterium]
MNRRNVVISLLWSLCVVAGFAGTVSAGDQVPFRGGLEGSYTVTVVPPIGTFVGSGIGMGTHLGRFTYEFPHTVNFGTVPPIGTGTYSFTAANGDRVHATFTGQSTPVAPGFVYVVEECVITGGTGRFTNASGRFTVMRLVDQVNRRTSGSFEGTISSPGTNKR